MGDWKSRLLPSGNVWQDVGRMVAWWTIVCVHWRWAFEGEEWPGTSKVLENWRRTMMETLSVMWWSGERGRERMELLIVLAEGKVQRPVAGGRMVGISLRGRDGSLGRSGVG